MTTILLVRRCAADVARNGVNVFAFVAVPGVFVAAAAGMLADIGRILGGTGDDAAIAGLSAGWSAAFVAAVAMYFQVSGARGTDRRLVGAGLRRSQLVAARMVTAGLIALFATTVALLTLLLRTGGDVTWRIALGALLFAGVYLGIGAVVGASIRNPLNGTVVLLFVWLIDVFFGPGLSSSDAATMRFLPTHYVASWVIAPAGSPSSGADLARGVGWLAGATVLAFWAVLATTSVGRRRRVAPPVRLGQLRTGLRMAWRSWRRTPVMWALLVAVPAVFIWLADATTPHGVTRVEVHEAGQTFTAAFDPAEIHGGTMAPIAVASLAALAGVLISIDSHAGDGRLAIAGQRTWVLAATRLAAATIAALVATVAALAVAGALFDARQWPVYAAGNLLVAETYALVGLLVGPIVGRVAGTLLAFLVPFIDVGLGQSPMLHLTTPAWALVLPGYGGTRMAIVLVLASVRPASSPATPLGRRPSAASAQTSSA
jgi:hypothetical protein